MSHTVADLIRILKTKQQDLPVEFIVVEKDTSLVCMALTSEVCDQEKIFKAFKRPKRGAAK